MWAYTILLCFAGLDARGKCAHWDFVTSEPIYRTMRECTEAGGQHADALAARRGWAPVVSGMLCGYRQFGDTEEGST